MTVRILHGNCVDLMAAMDAESVHCCVSSPPYWGLRDYGTEPVDWPAIAYAPMPGLPSCVEIPAMRSSLGLEPTLEAFVGHMVLVYRGVHRVLKEDGTVWMNMGDSYAGSRKGGDSGASTIHSPQPNHSMTESRRRDNEPVPRSDLKVPGLKVKDMMGQPWRLALALQADGWYLRSDIIWHKLNPMPESTKDRPTKAHEYIFLLSRSERYYYDWKAIREPASEDTHARYAAAKGKPFGMSSWEGRLRFEEAAAVGQTQPGRKSKKPVAGWASGEGDHSAINHAAPSADRAGRKLAEAGSGTKNNDIFDQAMAVMPDMANKRSVWPMPTEPFKGSHFATFPSMLAEPCILAGCPPGGTVLDMFGGSGTTGLVADRLGRNAILCELNGDYVDMQHRRVGADKGHVKRQMGLDDELLSH